MRLSASILLDSNPFSHIPELLTNTKITKPFYPKSGQELGYIKGKFKNLTIKVSQYFLTIEGSLSGYYLGNNFLTLTRSQAKGAIEQLSKYFMLPLAQADILRLDFAFNMIVENHVEQYFPLIGNRKHCKRNDNYGKKGSLYVGNKSRTFIFYNKTQCAIKKGFEIPPQYQSKNILRFEVRLLKNPSGLLGKKELKAFDLYQEGFFMEMIEYWKSGYFSIEKYRELVPPSELRQPKDLYKEALGYMAHQMGVDNFLAEKLKYCTNPSHKARIKKMIKEASNFLRESEGSALISELDTEVEKSVKTMLNDQTK